MWGYPVLDPSAIACLREGTRPGPSYPHSFCGADVRDAPVETIAESLRLAFRYRWAIFRALTSIRHH